VVRLVVVQLGATGASSWTAPHGEGEPLGPVSGRGGVEGLIDGSGCRMQLAASHGAAIVLGLG
jgi:hypothetical protein